MMLNGQTVFACYRDTARSHFPLPCLFCHLNDSQTILRSLPTSLIQALCGLVLFFLGALLSHVRDTRAGYFDGF